MKLKAVFLDKDGTIKPDTSRNINSNSAMLNEGVIEGLQLLQSNGYLLVVVTDRLGASKGKVSPDQVDEVSKALSTICSKIGIYLDGFYTCIHHPEGNCECRKPNPGLLLQAASEMDIDLSCSWMIGDILNDVEAGKKAGCKTILIDDGEETEWKINEHRNPEYKARDLAEAARFILTA